MCQTPELFQAPNVSQLLEGNLQKLNKLKILYGVH